MTDLAEDYTPDTLGAAQLALSVAVDQLTQPGQEHLDRDDPQQSPAAREVAAEDEQHMATLRRQHAAAQAARHHGQARRYLQRIIALQHRINARRADRADLPSLLDQLLGAVESSSNNAGGGSTAGVHRSVIGLSAAEIVHDIEITTRWGNTASGGHDPHPDLAVQLRRWAARSPHWRVANPNYLINAARRAEDWVTAARTQLNPPRRWSHPGRCPNCGAAVAQVPDDTGQIVRRPALELDRTTATARCLNCPARWESERLPLLAAVLEQQANDREGGQLDEPAGQHRS